RATLLARGLSGLDDETLAYLIAHPALISTLYQRGAAVFAAFGAALRIRDGVVVTPGGAEFAAEWQTIVGVSPARSEQFVRVLFTEFGGRLAYLLDVIQAASPGAAKFALGVWLPADARATRFKALADAVQTGYHEWQPAEHPFARPLGDLGMLLL